MKPLFFSFFSKNPKRPLLPAAFDRTSSYTRMQHTGEYPGYQTGIRPEYHRHHHDLCREWR